MGKISKFLNTLNFLVIIPFISDQASPIGGVGGTTPLPPRDGPKNQLTFLFKAFFSFFWLIISYTLWNA